MAHTRSFRVNGSDAACVRVGSKEGAAMRVLRFSKVGPVARALSLLVVALLTVTACASLGSPQGASAGASSYPAPAVHSAPDPSPAPPSPSLFPSPGNDTAPRLITPTTGGPPVLGIPLGGNIFLPVTGGPPVSGIPLFP